MKAGLLLLLGITAASGSTGEPGFEVPSFARFRAAEAAPDIAEPEADPPPTSDDSEGDRPRQFPDDEFSPNMLGSASLSYGGVRKLAPADYPAFADDLDAASLRLAAERSDAYLARLGDATSVAIAGRRYTVGQLRQSARELARLAAQGPAALAAALASRFDVFESVGRAGKVVFTGYYEPEIEATAVGDAAHPVPILAAPNELQSSGRGAYDYLCRSAGGRRSKLSPCWTRAQIDRGALGGRRLELGWANAADLFDLQLQGSGWVVVGGARRRLAFDSTNGRPFRSAERALLDRGGLPAGEDFFGFVRAQPLRRQLEILERNPRYTFFHEGPANDEGPMGAIGAPLTAHRSLAVSRQMPRGLPAFMSVAEPVLDGSGRAAGTAEVRRFAFAQDAGKAISDPGRVDIFWGTGARAAAEARHMKAAGKLYFVVLRP